MFQTPQFWIRTEEQRKKALHKHVSPLCIWHYQTSSWHSLEIGRSDWLALHALYYPRVPCCQSKRARSSANVPLTTCHPRKNSLGLVHKLLRMNKALLILALLFSLEGVFASDVYTGGYGATLWPNIKFFTSGSNYGTTNFSYPDWYKTHIDISHGNIMVYHLTLQVQNP